MNKELMTKYLKNYKVFCQGEDFHSGHIFFTGNFHNHYPVYKYNINDEDVFKQDPALELWEFIYFLDLIASATIPIAAILHNKNFLSLLNILRVASSSKAASCFVSLLVFSILL